MAQMTAPEKNAVRKALRLLDNNENKGDPTYDHQCKEIASLLREMLMPTLKFNLLVPEDCPVRLKAVHYEIGDNGEYYLYCSWKEPPKPKEKKDAAKQTEPAGA